MNTVDALNAVAIQAPSSKLMPRCPLKSASPRERRRAARLESAAPMTTAKTPRSGLCARSAGSTDRNAAMRSRAVTGAVAVAELVIGYLKRKRDARDDRKDEALDHV